MDNTTPNTAPAQDVLHKATYQTPELVDYDAISVTTQSTLPTDIQNGSFNPDAQG